MKYASNKSVFKIYEYIQPFLKYSTPLEDKIPGSNVLVIAPHQDDESIGCGGTIIKHVRDGGHLEIVFVRPIMSELKKQERQQKF